jgi:nucleoside-diphosphate-sugar epimerase
MPVSFVVTGATGFVGRVLSAALPSECHALSLGPAHWEAAIRAAPLAGATIFHLAARVHDPHDRDAAAFEHDNVGKTRVLAEEAVRQGARRIVLLSSVKVHGEETRGRAFGPQDAPAPADAYARSKLGAENVMRQLAGAGGIEWTIVRSPLVFGPGAKANLASLMRLANTPWPLPFAAVANRRSFIHATDLARLLVVCGEATSAVGQVFLAAYPEPASTPGIVAALRRALGRPARLFSMPPVMLEAGAAIVGQAERMRRLTRSLEVDASAVRERLGWQAALGLDESAADMARAWRGHGA